MAKDTRFQSADETSGTLYRPEITQVYAKSAAQDHPAAIRYLKIVTDQLNAKSSSLVLSATLLRFTSAFFSAAREICKTELRIFNHDTAGCFNCKGGRQGEAEKTIGDSASLQQ